MTKAVASLASGVAGGLISSGLLVALGGPPIGRNGWIIVSAVSAIAFLGSWVLQKRRGQTAPAGHEVLSNVAGGRDVVLKDVDVRTSGSSNVRAAVDLTAERDVTVSGLRVDHQSHNDKP